MRRFERMTMTDERTRLIEALKMLKYLEKYFQEQLKKVS